MIETTSPSLYTYGPKEICLCPRAAFDFGSSSGIGNLVRTKSWLKVVASSLTLGCINDGGLPCW